MGGIVGEDPVPITNLVPSYRFVPTLTSWGETKTAWPRTYSTSFRDARTSAYFALRRSATKRSFERITARNSEDHPSSRWSPGKGWFATRKNWSPTARRRLLGTQPTFTHVPPIVPPSIINASAPFRSARIAALKAAAPPPRIIRSCRFAIRSTFPSSPPISLSGKKLVCSTCGMKFSSEGALRQHGVVHAAPKPRQAPAPSCPCCGATFSLPEELRAYVRQRQGMYVGGRPCRSFLFLARMWKGTSYSHVHKAWGGHNDKAVSPWDPCSRRSPAHKHGRPSSVRWTESFFCYPRAFDPREAVEILGALQMCGRSGPTGAL